MVDNQVYECICNSRFCLHVAIMLLQVWQVLSWVTSSSRESSLNCKQSFPPSTHLSLCHQCRVTASGWMLTYNNLLLVCSVIRSFFRSSQLNIYFVRICMYYQPWIWNMYNIMLLKFLIAQSKLNALSFFKKQKNALIRGAFTRIGILLPSRLTSYKFGKSL